VLGAPASLMGSERQPPALHLALFTEVLRI
jgi:hypothetical protein